VALADARGAEEQGVAPLRDEACGRQVDDPGLGQLRVEVEVEVVERPAVLELGPLNALLEHLGVATLDLVMYENWIAAFCSRA
jgi:hypothetical protein